MKNKIEELDLTKFIEIYECRSYKKVNNYLKLGWILFNRHTVGENEYGQYTVYCLGWTNSSEKPKHPPEKYSRPMQELV